MSQVLQTVGGQRADVSHRVSLKHIKFGELIKYGQRPLNEARVNYICKLREGNKKGDALVGGLCTFDMSAEDLMKDPKKIQECKWHPYGGQHGMKAHQRFIEGHPSRVKQYSDGNFRITTHQLLGIRHTQITAIAVFVYVEN